MADYVQTMKDWHRMCKAYTTDDKSCCEGCPVVDFLEGGCGAIFEMDDSTDWQRYADTIATWAAKHPEPVYPTWGEWLVAQDIITEYGRIECGGSGTCGIFTDKGERPIPADIAQKLGIEPKEG